MLTITEDLFLITLYERKNSIAPSPLAAVPYALVGAMFVDLIAAGKIRLNEEKRVHLADTAPTGHPFLDMLIDTIQVTPKQKKLTYWITVFGSRYKRLQRHLFEGMVDKGFLILADEQYAWAIPCPGEPHPKASIKFQRKERLRSIVLGGEPLDERSSVTLYLLNIFGLLDCLFTPDEAKSASRKLREALKTETGSTPLLRQIDEISTAAAIASAMSDPI
jgi:hypothetical protein